ncbi:ATP-binding protein [Streptomyces sp. VNUA116]|uniref:ATP-binding protein n=1 Tax=Streptomyces sp. VNUA116 TaxID=3062449 RepID=UPI0026761E18|nr:ATP-binding protein [Streptomyces sp. VNUA116]WKU46713.1 ATP-binding protein [Streptomyces sp. VNUA116]
MACEPKSALRARLLVSAALNIWDAGGLVDSGTLIVSELFANAVKHTRCSAVRVLIRRPADGVIRIGVADRSHDIPLMHCPVIDPENEDVDEEADEGGRGLVLVDALSWRWGYDRRRWGKVVWAELRIERSA